MPADDGQPSLDDRASSSVALAVRRAGRFDRSALSVRAGVVAAIPVLGVLAAGVLAGDTVAAVTMGAGAMLVGIAWRAGGGVPPVGAMAADAAIMGLSTFAGAVSGTVVWLHIALLAAWAFTAGLFVAVGRRGAIVGTQAIIAFVVFGRFPQPVSGALGLAGLVVAGGAVEVVFCALFGAPPAVRIQRSAVAEAYRQFADLAVDPDARSAEAGAALDEADRRLSSPTLLGDAETMGLTALVQEARRMRLEFTALWLLLGQYGRERGAAETPLRDATDRVRRHAAEALQAIAVAVEENSAAARVPPAVEELDAAVEALADIVPSESPGAGARIAEGVERHAVALAGEIRAAAGIAAGVHERRGRIAVRPSLGSTSPRDRLAADLDEMRANASTASPAGRHALRLAVIIPTITLLAEHLPLGRGYWVVVAAATVLRPDFGATFTRGVERMAGTSIGVVIAGLLAVALHPTGWGTVVLVGVLACAAYTLFPASFAAGVVFLNGMIVFLLEAVAPSTLTTALERGVDTLVGGGIALLAYVLWPTWSSMSARQALDDLVAKQRAYVGAVLGAVAAGRVDDEDALRSLARAARLAWTTAEATLEQSLTDPATRRIDIDQARGAMTGLRRIVQAAHVVRLELEASEDSRPLPALRPLAEAIDFSLGLIGQALTTGLPPGPPARRPEPPPGGAPPLRALYRDLRASTSADPVLMTELDEIVDAVDTVAAPLGIEQDGEEPAESGPAETRRTQA